MEKCKSASLFMIHTPNSLRIALHSSSFAVHESHVVLVYSPKEVDSPLEAVSFIRSGNRVAIQGER